jgi:hypothetical protein
MIYSLMVIPIFGLFMCIIFKDPIHINRWDDARLAVEKNACLSNNWAMTPEFCDCWIEVAEFRGLVTLKGTNPFDYGTYQADLTDRCPSVTAKLLRAWTYLQERNGKS